MMLLLDIGNTSVKWGYWNNDEITGTGEFRYRGGNLAVLLEHAWKKLPVPDAVAVSNVGGAAVADVISSWVAGNWNTSPVYLAVSSSAAGLSNAYENPRDLGVDRWAAMIAAYHDCQDTVCVIDCGSAITIDVVRADGLHLGGMIAPGLDMMRRSLAGNAAGIRLPPDDTAQPVKLLANSTAEAVNNGTVYMAAAMIDRVIADVAARHHADVEVVITGGDAHRIMPLLGATPRFVPELVLRGVAIIAMETACDT